MALCASLALATAGCGASAGDGQVTDGDASVAAGSVADADDGTSDASDGQAAEGAGGSGSEGSLPDDFPAAVPLPDLPIASAIPLTSAEGWIANFRTDDQPGDMEKAHGMLNDAGFEDSYWGADTGNGLVKNADYEVEVLLSDSEPWISFVVTPVAG
ncbi:hypothetical protein [Pseudactinotalea sp. HY158]|uniref:hypothetical protein n=1 Tax=Pseudactinotalea sp. HY158 TaxID=2654547 RepID=UPI00129CDB57|nr:hypothetical protein [Pseudactinotalea sp. HY158]QGH70137.1 hypothetical protein GCE65_11920 [Pseudactinotalea sp. HY158]